MEKTTTKQEALKQKPECNEFTTNEIKEQLKQEANNNLLDYLVNATNVDYYDIINKLHQNWVDEQKKDKKEVKELTRDEIVKNKINNFLSDYGVEAEDLREYKEQNNDFWNDGDKDGRCWCDIAQEQADGVCSIYNYTLWQEAPILSDYIEEALNEFGFEGCGVKERGIIGIFQMGQYHFYSGFYNEVLSNIKKYVDEELKDKA